MHLCSDVLSKAFLKHREKSDIHILYVDFVFILLITQVQDVAGVLIHSWALDNNVVLMI